MTEECREAQFLVAERAQNSFAEKYTSPSYGSEGEDIRALREHVWRLEERARRLEEIVASFRAREAEVLDWESSDGEEQNEKEKKGEKNECMMHQGIRREREISPIALTQSVGISSHIVR